MQHVIIGAVIFAFGAIVTLGSMAVSEETGFELVATGALGWGAIQIIYGLGKMGFDSLKPKAVKQQDQQDTEKFAFIHSMIAMTAADDKVETAEIKRVMELFQRVMNMSVSEADVRKIAEEYQHGGRSWNEAIDFNAQKMSPERRGTLFKACVMVASADGELAEKERARIHELAKHVGVAPEDEERVIKETLALLKTELAGKAGVAVRS
jgi:uncharacterized tellurite resistance protein B-like protein